MKNKFIFEIGEFDLDLYGVIHTFYKDFDNIEKAEDFCFNKSDDSSKYLILSEKNVRNDLKTYLHKDHFRV